MNHTTCPHRPGAPRQAGFTLIELLVAMTLGLFLFAALVAVVFNIKTTFKAQGQLSQSQDSGTLALTVLSNAIQSAGQTVSGSVVTPAINPDGSSFAAGQGVVGTTGSGSTGGIPNSDTLNLLYASSGTDGVTNCLGQTATAPTTWVNSFAVDPVNHTLTCAVATNGGAAGPAVALVNNVYSLTTRYEVDTSSGGANGTPDSYLTATKLAGNPTQWLQVYSVQLNLTLLAGDNLHRSATGPGTSIVQNINVMGQIL